MGFILASACCAFAATRDSLHLTSRLGALDFESFTAILKDLDVRDAVASKRVQAYDLPVDLLKAFSKVKHPGFVGARL